MNGLQGTVDALAGAVSRTGDAAPLILCFAALVEYVFPPFPGDLLIVLGAWYAVQGVLSWPSTFVSVTVGALAGAWIDYRVGAALGRRLDRRVASGDSAFLSAERLARFEASYRRWGDLLILGNRFLPGVRAFLFIAAGASRIPQRRVMLLGGLSAAVWNALLLGAGALLARNAEELVFLFQRYTQVAWALLALAGVVWLAAFALRRRVRAPGPEGGP